jgi:hypothetical protein
MRSDFILTSDKFLSYWDKFQLREREFVFFKNRVLACCTYSRNPRYNFNIFRMPFCPSDFFFFGLREDIINLFSLDLINREPLKTLFQTELSVDNPVSFRAAHGVNLVFRGSQ